MHHTFDKDYWDDIWSSERAGAMSTSDASPHLTREIDGLSPGSALDAGCGAGAEAMWLACAGWTVTAVDVAAAALTFGENRAAEAGLGDRVNWVLADLSTWVPDQQFHLVTTHYAHPAIPQLEFYRRIATWVAPGGTLLIVGHLHHEGSGGHGHKSAGIDNSPPAEASVSAPEITGLLTPDEWEIATAQESQRVVTGPGGRETTLNDVVVRATRRA